MLKRLARLVKGGVVFITMSVPLWRVTSWWEKAICLGRLTYRTLHTGTEQGWLPQ